jgi:hypothetical protein
VRLVRPIPVLRASELDARIEDVVRFDEFEIFEQHQSGEHSKLLAYRDGRLVLFTTREKVPGFWKTVSARLPTRPVKWVVPTTSSVTAPSGVEVEVLPPAQVHELMLRDATRLERLPVTTSK